MTDRFEDIFKNNFQGFEVNPPEAVFQRLSENKQLFRAGHSLRNSIIISASVITVVLLTSLYFFNQDTEPKPNNIQPVIKQNVKKVEPIVKEQDNNTTNTVKKNIPTKNVTTNNSTETPIKNTNYFVSAGHDTAICDNNYQLKAHSNIKGFIGRWICANKNAVISNSKQSNPVVHFKAIDTYQIIYSGFSGQTFYADTLNITVNGIPPENRVMDTTI